MSNPAFNIIGGIQKTVPLALAAILILTAGCLSLFVIGQRSDAHHAREVRELRRQLADVQRERRQLSTENGRLQRAADSLLVQSNRCSNRLLRAERTISDADEEVAMEMAAYVQRTVRCGPRDDVRTQLLQSACGYWWLQQRYHPHMPQLRDWTDMCNGIANPDHWDDEP